MNSPVDTPSAPTTTPPQSLDLLTPGALKVIKRDRRVVAYNPDRVATAIKKAFLAVEGDSAADSNRINEIANQLTNLITQQVQNDGPMIDIEVIQNKVEFALMCAGEHKVARSYVLYREARHQARLEETAAAEAAKQEQPSINVTLSDGSTKPLDRAWLKAIVDKACEGIEAASSDDILAATEANLFDGVALTDVQKTLVLTARTHVENDPDYTFVSARLLLRQLQEENFTALGIQHDISETDFTSHYKESFHAFMSFGIEHELLMPECNDFDLDRLADALDPSRDHLFTYLSMQTLYDRYFIHWKEQRIELPQIFFMRVAMGLAHCEGDQRNERAIEFYNLISQFDYMPSTPTLFNSGTCHPQLSSCFLTTIPDCLNGIYGSIKDNAMLSKFAGGIGNDWTPVRGLGARIKGTNGKSLGVVPFMNVADATAIAVNQGGKRKGAVCGYLETWHMDVEEFLELRKNTGDDRRRTHDMNTANWVPDLFMERVMNDQNWTLFSPDDTPDLHDSYGQDFRNKYEAYEAQVEKGTLRGKTIRAVDLWRKMLGMLFETGHPWITFKDPCNIRSPQQHAGVIHSSNLCTEITLNTRSGAGPEGDEIAVCNLGSINLVRHIKNGKLDEEKLAKTVQTAVRMLDNVIDINYYTVDAARNANIKHRPVGLGIMGFQDALFEQGIAYSSDAAVQFADRSMEAISWHAIHASTVLAEERGTYSSYEGSLWDQGIMPIDSIEMLMKERGGHIEQNQETTLDWKALRKRVKKAGMRNSNLMAIAPTATISNICGVSQSIEPTYQNLYVKSNMSGEFTVVNTYLARDLKALGLWDQVMVHDLKYYNGSVQSIDRIPAELKQRYATAFEVSPRWLIESASRRQKWIDQAQSLNLYMAEPSGKKLDIVYKMAWIHGLKTTYYLRSIGATSTEKATISDGALNAVQTGAPKMCAIDDPDCEACQ